MQQGISAAVFDLFRADPVQVEGGILGKTSVAQGLHHREVGVIELHVLADQGHLHGRTGVAHLVHQLLPGAHVALMVGEIEHIQHFPAQPLFFEGLGHGINAVGIEGGDHRPLVHATESADFAFEFSVDLPVAAAHQHIRLDADRAQLLHRVLGGFGLQFA